jgi:hypothetical protein
MATVATGPGPLQKSEFFSPKWFLELKPPLSILTHCMFSNRFGHHQQNIV